MRLAEALSRCPALELVAADPVRAEAVWEDSLRRLEALGAAVEPARPGEAFFGLEPLRALYGAPPSALSRTRRELGPPVRFGAGPNRLSASAAAARTRVRQPPPIVDRRAARRLVAGLPVSTLRDRLRGEWERAQIPDTLERLGVRTLGELAKLPAEAVADRFGEPGLAALRLARGVDDPLRPRPAPEQLVERIRLPEAACGPQLEHALSLLIERLLARPARAGRTIRALRLEAGLAAGGGWRSEVALRNASASAERLWLAIVPRLGELPGPASRLALRALELGPEIGEQATLAHSPRDRRRGRLAEAVRQVRATAGRDSLLRVIEVDPGSHVPERRAILTPWSVDDG
jgi:protein ImuB